MIILLSFVVERKRRSHQLCPLKEVKCRTLGLLVTCQVFHNSLQGYLSDELEKLLSLSLSLYPDVYKMLDSRKFTKETTFLPQECHSVKKIHFWEESGGLWSTHAVSIKQSTITLNAMKLWCFDIVFQRPYRYFSIALKVILSLSNRYKIFTND